VKGELNKIIDRISDGRVRRKYAVRKDDYAYIIELLLLDELIYSAQANGATYLNDLYLARRNRRNPVSEEEIRKARQAAEMFWVHD
jgi:hypothetical protein